MMTSCAREAPEDVGVAALWPLAGAYMLGLVVIATVSLFAALWASAACRSDSMLDEVDATGAEQALAASGDAEARAFHQVEMRCLEGGDSLEDPGAQARAFFGDEDHEPGPWPVAWLRDLRHRLRSDAPPAGRARACRRLAAGLGVLAGVVVLTVASTTPPPPVVALCAWDEQAGDAATQLQVLLSVHNPSSSTTLPHVRAAGQAVSAAGAELGSLEAEPAELELPPGFVGDLRLTAQTTGGEAVGALLVALSADGVEQLVELRPGGRRSKLCKCGALADAAGAGPER